MTLALVRHGRTAWNRARRMQGRTDIPLDAHGRAQADAAGRALSVAVWQRIVASPLSRARETAEIIAGRIPDVAIEHNAALVERGYGDAEGLSVAEAQERWPDDAFPGGESVADATERGVAALLDLADTGHATIVVAHGTLIRLAVSRLTGEACPRVPNGQVVLLARDGDRFRSTPLTG